MKWHCEICNVDLSFTSKYKHIKGEAHEKNKERKERIEPQLLENKIRRENYFKQQEEDERLKAEAERKANGLLKLINQRRSRRTQKPINYIDEIEETDEAEIYDGEETNDDNDIYDRADEEEIIYTRKQRINNLFRDKTITEIQRESQARFEQQLTATIKNHKETDENITDKKLNQILETFEQLKKDIKSSYFKDDEKLLNNINDLFDYGLITATQYKGIMRSIREHFNKYY